MIVGGYSMNLYCANDDCDIKAEELYTGQTERQCRKQARRDGWRFTKGDVFCSEHSKKQDTK